MRIKAMNINRLSGLPPEALAGNTDQRNDPSFTRFVFNAVITLLIIAFSTTLIACANMPSTYDKAAEKSITSSKNNDRAGRGRGR